MAKVTVIFVGGDTLVDQVIEEVTGGAFSHTAIKILGGVLESTGIMDVGDKYPGVHLRDAYKYDNDPTTVFVDVDVPDLSAAEQKANSLLGKYYSYVACLDGLSHTLFGISLPSFINKLISWLVIKVLRIPANPDTGEWAMDCSETVTRILRAGGVTICPDMDADEVTPMDLYRDLTGDRKLRNNRIAAVPNEKQTNTVGMGSSGEDTYPDEFFTREI